MILYTVQLLGYVQSRHKGILLYHMNMISDTILFSLDNIKYGLGSENFVRAIRAVGITPLPKAPDSILGVINLHGNVIPVINIRKKLGLESKLLSINDKMIILKIFEKFFAIVVDDVCDYLNKQELIQSEKISDGIEFLDGVIKVDGDIIAVIRIASLLREEDERSLVNSLKELNN